MAHTFDAAKFATRKQAKQDIEDQPSSEIKNVPELKERVLKLEKVVGITSA
jgi:hypothetical protein